jgi:hypothetical protein
MSLALIFLLFYATVLVLIFGWLPRVTPGVWRRKEPKIPEPTSGSGANGGGRSSERSWVSSRAAGLWSGRFCRRDSGTGGQCSRMG